MPFNKYTQCEDVGDFGAADYAQKLLFTDIGWIRKTFAVLILVVIGGVLAPAALVAILLTIIAYCNWWLFKRLICLGGDRCAIGLLVSVEPASEKTGFDALDTDYSINLLLAPHSLGWGQNPAEQNDGMQGVLIQEQPTTANAKIAGVIKTFPFAGNMVKAGSDGAATVYQQPTLHAEFEGRGVQDFKDSAEAALPFALLASAACSIPFPLFTLVCLVLSVIAGAITVAGFFSAKSDQADPTDLDPALKDLHRHKDILLVKGEWVYDSAHEGWNELHPIKQCLRIGLWQGTWDTPYEWDEHYDAWTMSSWPPDPILPPNQTTATVFLTIDPKKLTGGKPAKGTVTFPAPLAAAGTVVLTSSDPSVFVPPTLVVPKGEIFQSFDVTTKPVAKRVTVILSATFAGVTRSILLIVRPIPTVDDWNRVIKGWCDALTDATATATVVNQQQPQNQWTVHPEIDGCQPAEAPPPPPPPADGLH